MMLTVKQPTTYGYGSVQDLPTPPSTSRPSPPLSHPETLHHHYSSISRSHSPVNGTRIMSAPHRGLPPPAVMAHPPQQASSSSGVPPASHHTPQQQQQQQPPPSHLPQNQGQPSHPHVPPGQQPWTALPPPPSQHWHGAEEAMRNWLQAKAEEEKTRQESLRLEQRRVEMDMLRDSLRGGIPPPMIPLVFAGMGSSGTLPQAALDWAQQFFPPSQSQHLQLLPAQQQQSPDSQPREGHTQSHGQYPSGPGNQPPPPQASGHYGPYPGSPSRPRGQTVSGIVVRTAGAGNVPHAGQSGPAAGSAYGGGGGGSGHPVHILAPSGPQESSPGLYFHHWQPPATQSGSGSSNRPGSSSGEPSKKRKVSGPQSAETPSEPRPRSPSFIQTTLSNPPPTRKGGHKRQKSDVSWYRPAGFHSMEESERAPQPLPPSRILSPNRDMKAEYTRDRYAGESSRHSVSKLLLYETSGQNSHESRPHFPSHHEEDRPIPRHREEAGMRRERGSPRRESD